MNVSLKNNDAVSGIVKLEIVKADYADQVDKSLRSLRQKANVPGFRKGMVPRICSSISVRTICIS